VSQDVGRGVSLPGVGGGATASGADTHALRARVEALAPLAVEVWEQTMRSAEKDADRLRAADAVMARVMPIMAANGSAGPIIHIHLSREERRAIEVVAREIGRELPALPAPEEQHAGPIADRVPDGRN